MMHTTLTEDYHGHTIRLNGTFHFEVVGPLANGQDRWFDSYADATAEVDRWFKVAEKQKRAEASLVAQMLNRHGLPVTIRSIHSGTGQAIGAGDITDEIYPDVPRVAQWLEERGKLARRILSLDGYLRKISVRTRRTYGRVSPDAYEAEIAKLSADIAAARDLAEKDA